jgi:hypothetical protein
MSARSRNASPSLSRGIRNPAMAAGHDDQSYRAALQVQDQESLSRILYDLPPQLRSATIRVHNIVQYLLVLVLYPLQVLRVPHLPPLHLPLHPVQPIQHRPQPLRQTIPESRVGSIDQIVLEDVTRAGGVTGRRTAIASVQGATLDEGVVFAYVYCGGARALASVNARGGGYRGAHPSEQRVDVLSRPVV